VRIGWGDVTSGFRGAEGYSLVLDRYQLRRGESLMATIMVTDSSLITGIFELGLVCTERWAEYHQSAGGAGGFGGAGGVGGFGGAGGVGSAGRGGRRVIQEAVLYQWWMPLDRNQPQTNLTLPVVPDAPFSHVGTALSFLWTVTARDRRSGFDHLDRHDVEVLP
jgi:hypothetical protein